MYKPAAQRRWGYYALPILYGDRLVGKLDATADRKAGVLRVDAVHQDAPFSTAMAAAVEDEITDLARWLQLDIARDSRAEANAIRRFDDPAWRGTGQRVTGRP